MERWPGVGRRPRRRGSAAGCALRSRVAALGALVATAHSTGCYQWVEVTPAELSRITAPEVRSAEAPPERRLPAARSPRRADRQPSRDAPTVTVGPTREVIPSTFDARVVTDDATHVLEHPGVATVEGPWLVLREPGREVRVPLATIRRVEVDRPDEHFRAGAIAVGIVVGSVLGLFILVAIVNPPKGNVAETRGP